MSHSGQIFTRVKKMMIRYSKVIATVLFLTLGYEGSVLSLETENINKIKAAYIYNILKFTTWPSNITQNDEQPINICLAGLPDTTEQWLAEGIKDRTIKNKNLIITHIPELTNVPDEKNRDIINHCTLIYFGVMPQEQESSLIERTRTQAILTISDHTDFSQRGGIIELKTDLPQKKIFIIINIEAAQQADINFSSNLLKLSFLVNH